MLKAMYVKVTYFRFVKNTYFQAVKNKNLETSVLAFFKQENLPPIYKMTSVRKSYTFQNLFKNITLTC